MLKKLVPIILMLVILVNFYILVGKVVWGDDFVFFNLKTTNYYNPAIFLLAGFAFFIYWYRHKITDKNIHFLVILSLIIIFFAFMQYDYYPIKVEGDGVGYFVYLRSPYFDNDIHFKNEYRWLDAAKYGVHGWIDARGFEHYPKVKRTGYCGNAFSIGPSFLWYPFYYLADITYRQIDPQRTGYEHFYLRYIHLAHIFYALLGVIFLYLTLSRFFSPPISFISILIITFLSPTLFYLKNQIFYSHILSFFTVAFFMMIFVWGRNRANLFYWALLGFAGGLATLTRWQNMIIILIPVLFLLARLLKDEWIKRKTLIVETIKLVIFAGVFVITIIPQINAFKTIYGRLFIIPQGKNFITFFPQWFFQTLFSSFHGLVYWHPVLIIGMVGFFLKYKGNSTLPNNRWYYASHGLGFGMHTYINSSISQYWAGASFGARRFIDSFAFLAMGIANFLENIWNNKKIKIVLIIILNLFFIINIFMEKAMHFGFINSESPVSWSELLSGSWQAFLMMGQKNLKWVLYIFIFIGFCNWLCLSLIKKTTEKKATPQN